MRMPTRPRIRPLNLRLSQPPVLVLKQVLRAMQVALRPQAVRWPSTA